MTTDVFFVGPPRTSACFLKAKQHINVYANISYFFDSIGSKTKILQHHNWRSCQRSLFTAVFASLLSEVEIACRNRVPKYHRVYMARRIVSLQVRIVLHEDNQRQFIQNCQKRSSLHLRNFRYKDIKR